MSNSGNVRSKTRTHCYALNKISKWLFRDIGWTYRIASQWVCPSTARHVSHLIFDRAYRLTIMAVTDLFLLTMWKIPTNGWSTWFGLIEWVTSPDSQTRSWYRDEMQLFGRHHWGSPVHCADDKVLEKEKCQSEFTTSYIIRTECTDCNYSGCLNVSRRSN
jgi:hypothetical protein